MDKINQNEIISKEELRRLASGKVTDVLYRPKRVLIPPFKKTNECVIEPYGKGVFAIGVDFKLIFYPYETSREPADQRDPNVAKRLALYLLRFDFVYRYCAEKVGVSLIHKAIKTTQEDDIRFQNNYRGGLLDHSKLQEAFEYYQEQHHRALIQQMNGFLKDPFIFRLIRHKIGKIESIKMKNMGVKPHKNKTFYGRLGRWVSHKKTMILNERGSRES